MFQFGNIDIGPKKQVNRNFHPILSQPLGVCALSDVVKGRVRAMASLKQTPQSLLGGRTERTATAGGAPGLVFRRVVTGLRAAGDGIP